MTDTRTSTGQVLSARLAPRPRLLILGCGSAFSGDDQAGLVFIQRLQSGGRCESEMKPMPQAGVTLLESFSHVDILLVVDAISSGAPPGTLHLVSLPSAALEPRSLRVVSGHGWGLQEVLDLARALGRPVPRLLLLGIEIGSVEQGVTLTPAVERAVAQAVDRFEALESILTDPVTAAWQSPHRFLPGDDNFPFGVAGKDGSRPVAVV